MTALRFYTGGRHQKSPASLWGEVERQTDRWKETERCFDETRNCSVMHYDHLSGRHARKKIEHERIMTRMTEHTHKHVHARTQSLSLSLSHTHTDTQTHRHTHRGKEKLLALRVMLTVIKGNTIHCAKK